MLSVFIAVEPKGFELLEELARREDRDANWIARQNLKKARLAQKYPQECARVTALMER